MSPEEFFLIRGSLVFIVYWLILAVGGGILGNQGKVGDPAFCFLDGGKGSVPGIRQRGQFTFQFFIGADTMLRNEVDRLGSLFQILQLRSMLEPGALLALDIHEQPDLIVTLFRLPGRAGASGDPGGNGFLCIVNAQGL